MKVPVSQVELDIAVDADLTTIITKKYGGSIGEFITIEESELLNDLDLSQEVMANDSVEF